MNDKQKQLILNLCTGEIDKARFLSAYGIGETDVSSEVSSSLKEAEAEHDADGVEYALMLGSAFSMPDDILSLIHNLVIQDWHTRHEDMIAILQKKANPESVVVLQQAIMLKPKLEYLDYDDYGSFYKKCLWALQAIGTPQAISVISECAASDDAALKEQAEYRLAKIQNREGS